MKRMWKWYAEAMRQAAQEDGFLFVVYAVLTMVIAPLILALVFIAVCGILTLFINFPLVMFIIAVPVVIATRVFHWLWKTRERAPKKAKRYYY